MAPSMSMLPSSFLKPRTGSLGLHRSRPQHPFPLSSAGPSPNLRQLRELCEGRPGSNPPCRLHGHHPQVCPAVALCPRLPPPNAFCPRPFAREQERVAPTRSHTLGIKLPPQPKPLCVLSHGQGALVGTLVSPASHSAVPGPRPRQGPATCLLQPNIPLSHLNGSRSRLSDPPPATRALKHLGQRRLPLPLRLWCPLVPSGACGPPLRPFPHVLTIVCVIVCGLWTLLKS